MKKYPGVITLDFRPFIEAMEECGKRVKEALEVFNAMPKPKLRPSCTYHIFHQQTCNDCLNALAGMTIKRDVELPDWLEVEDRARA